MPDVMPLAAPGTSSPAPAARAAASGGQSIRLAGVTKTWGATTAVDNIDLDVPAGSFTVLLGPSGCGKSTTLRMIAGLEPIASGQLLFGVRDVTRLPAAQRDISMVFQSYALFPHLSVAENITFGLKVRRVSRAERDARLKRVAALLGLSGLIHRKPSELSGGQQQRVALGRAIIAERPICLMDEPLSNLDAKLRHEMRVEIRALQQQLGFTMVYVTHDQVEAITMADQVVLMNSGRIEQVASPREIYARPASPFAARFIGTPPMNILDLDAMTGGKATGLLLGIRPEAVERAGADRPATLSGTVSAIEFLGADTLVDCTVGTQTLQLRLAGGANIERGELLALHLPQHELHLFDAATGHRQDHRLHEIGPLLRL
jgi:sn-glycerol 3-phosphate transport system ATP-binding protein